MKWDGQNEKHFYLEFALCVCWGLKPHPLGELYQSIFFMQHLLNPGSLWSFVPSPCLVRFFGCGFWPNRGADVMNSFGRHLEKVNPLPLPILHCPYPHKTNAGFPWVTEKESIILIFSGCLGIYRSKGLNYEKGFDGSR